MPYELIRDGEYLGTDLSVLKVYSESPVYPIGAYYTAARAMIAKTEGKSS